MQKLVFESRSLPFRGDDGKLHVKCATARNINRQLKKKLLEEKNISGKRFRKLQKRLRKEKPTDKNLLAISQL